MKKLLSVVISVYNEEHNLQPLHEQLRKHLDSYGKVDYELIFVNDGSADGSLAVLRSLVAQDSRVRIVNSHAILVTRSP
ncbi:MAG: glycosyltransferase [Alphaproteobacteria bacterium]|nr:glycosyltransferase [Alphaproteobacteria bacterium]